MTSQRMIEANRRNALKSTGPRTEAGKAISSKNAITHGLTARECPILPGDDEAAFNAFHEAMVRDLNPRGIMQHEIVDDLVQIRWKLRRIPLIEAEMMRHRQRKAEEIHAEKVRHKDVDPESLPPTTPVQILATEFHWEANAFERLELYRQRLTRSMHTALRELRKLREETGEDESDDTAERDTGLRPVPRREHEPEAHVTVEERKSEPVLPPNSSPDNALPEPVILPNDCYTTPERRNL